VEVIGMNAIKAMTTWMFAGSIAALTACEARVIDLGSDGGGGSGSRANDTTSGSYGGIAGASPCTLPAPPVVDAGAEAGASLAPLVGTWTGYIETSSNLTLRVTQQADGSVTASLTVGTGSVPPPPTSKSDVYPPGFGGPPGTIPYPYPGFPYTAVDASFNGTRLQLGVVEGEILKPWCELQTSFDWGPAAPGSCGCLPNWPSMGSASNDGPCTITNPSTGAVVSVACALDHACTIYNDCSCTSAGCSIDMGYPTSKLDVQLTSNHLDGSINLQGSPTNVHFTKSP
jgi:hypothetical protein